MNKIISVFLLVYKNQAKMDYALESIFFQKIPMGYCLELLVSDDGSPEFDESKLKNKLHDLAKTNQSIRWNFVRRSTNLGIVKHVNQVLSELTGDIIIPLAADDAFFDDLVVARITEHFHKNRCMIATGLRSVFDVDFKPMNRVDPKNSQREILRQGGGGVIDELLKHGNFISGACTSYHREVFERFGYFDESYHLLEDYPYYINYILSGGVLSYMDFPVIKYREGGVSNSGVVSDALRLDFVRLYESLLVNERVSKKYHRFLKFRLFKLRARSLSLMDFFCMPDVIILYYLKSMMWRFFRL